MEIRHPLAAFLHQDAPVSTVKGILFSCSVLIVRVPIPMNFIYPVLDKETRAVKFLKTVNWPSVWVRVSLLGVESRNFMTCL